MKKWIAALCVCVLLATVHFATNDKRSSSDSNNSNSVKTPGNSWLQLPDAEQTDFFVSSRSGSSPAPEQVLEAEASAGGRVFYRGGAGNGYLSGE